MRHLRRFIFLSLALGLVASTVLATQSSRSRSKDRGNPRELELRARKAEENLAKEYIGIATGFYELGDPKKAKEFLVRLSKLNSEIPGLKAKIDELEEEIMSANADRVILDVSKGWGEAVAEVQAGGAFRIVAAGDYKMTASLQMDVNGLPGGDPRKNLVPGVPFGALMGMVVTADGKPTKPFAIRSGVEHTSKKRGLLFLRVNTPPGAKCIGKVEAQISGKVVTRATLKKGKKKK